MLNRLSLRLRIFLFFCLLAFFRSRETISDSRSTFVNSAKNRRPNKFSAKPHKHDEEHHLP